MRQLAETHGALTVPDLAEILYGDNRARLAIATGVIIGLIAYLSANFLAIATVLKLVFGLSQTTGLLIGASIVVFYSIAGGKTGAMWIDFIQGLVMVLGSFLAMYVIYRHMGGYGAIFENLAANENISSSYLRIFDGSNYLRIFSYFIVFSVGFMGLPHVITKFYTIRKRSHLKWALPMSLVVYSIMVSFEFTGYATKYGVTELGWPAIDTADDSVYLFVSQMFPVVFQGVLFAVIVSAILSTANSLIVVGSSAFARDIYQRWLWPSILKEHPRFAFKEVALARVSAFIFSLIALLIVINPPSIIIWLGALGWGILASTILVPIVGGIYWQRATSAGATAAAAVGLVVSLVTGILDVGFDVEIYALPGFWGIIASAAIFYVVSSLPGTRFKE